MHICDVLCLLAATYNCYANSDVALDIWASMSVMQTSGLLQLEFLFLLGACHQ